MLRLQCNFLALRLRKNWTAPLCIPKRAYASTLGPKKGDRVVVAVSGGVDSSVTAGLLAEKDYDLSAIFMRNWDSRDESGTDKGCEWEKDWEDVQRVCRHLGLPCELIDLSKEYWNNVFEPSLHLWEAGETPNPDVWCNRYVKFGSLMDHVLQRNPSAWLASGHYAGVYWTYDGQKHRPTLMRPVDNTKDQSYYLSSIREASLSRTLFPLSDIPKTRTRELAVRYGLPTAERPESMGICFVGEKRRFEDFLAEYIPAKTGPLVELETGKEVGTHEGLWRYTIGQAAKIPGMQTKMFVSGKDTATNAIYVVPGSTHPALYSRGLVTRDFRWIWDSWEPEGLDMPGGLRARAQFRHRMSDVPCTVRKNEEEQLRIEFDEPQLAVAPGQVAALYDEAGSWCLGSGEIARTFPLPETKS